MKNGRSFKMENVHRNGFSGTLKVTDSLPDPQVLPKPARRKLTPEYKLRILQESEACHDRGAIGALLRREGLYSSSLTAFREQRDAGRLSSEKRNDYRQAQNCQMQQLKRKNLALEHEIDKLKVIVELQKKVSELLNLTLTEPNSERS